MNTSHVRAVLLALILVNGTLAFGLTFNMADPDLWHRLAMGELIHETGRVPRQDSFSYMPVKERWIDHEWGSGVVFHAIHRTVGDPGLAVLKVGLFAGAALAVFVAARRRIPAAERFGHPLAWAVTLWGMSAGYVTTVRCQAFTFLLFAVWLAALERVRAGDRRLIWIFPVTMLLWANLHGGFVAGLGLVAIYAAGAVLKRQRPWWFLAILGMSAAVTLINPYGFATWSYLVDAILMPRPDITEWRALPLAEAVLERTGFFLLLAASTVGIAWQAARHRDRLDPTALLLLIVTGVLAFLHQRHAVFFVLAASVFGWPLWFDALRSPWQRLRDRLGAQWAARVALGAEALVCTTLVAGSLLLWIGQPWQPRLDRSFYPVDAVAWTAGQKNGGNLLVPFNWGSYALWELHPHWKVSMDGRYEETYPPEVFDTVHDFHQHRGEWRRVLEDHHHDLILVHADTETARALLADPGWREVYRDELAVGFRPAQGR